MSAFANKSPVAEWPNRMKSERVGQRE